MLICAVYKKCSKLSNILYVQLIWCRTLFVTHRFAIVRSFTTMSSGSLILIKNPADLCGVVAVLAEELAHQLLKYGYLFFL